MELMSCAMASTLADTVRTRVDSSAPQASRCSMGLAESSDGDDTDQRAGIEPCE